MLKEQFLAIIYATGSLGLFLSIVATYVLSGTSEFVAGDIKNLPLFSNTLQNQISDAQPNSADPLIRAASTESIAALIEAGHNDDKTEAVRIFNDVLKSKDFYQADVFAGLSLPKKARRFIAIGPANLSDEQVIMFNRLLLESVYPEHIAKSFIASGENWRWMFASENIFILLFFVGLLFLPNSPRWLAMKNRTEEALAVLTKVNGRKQAEYQMQAIQAGIGKETGSLRELIQPGVWTAVLVGIMVMIFQQINGVNAIMMYAPTIFIEAGIGSASSAILRSVYLYTWVILCTVFAFWLTAKFPRRKIIMYTVSGIAVGHILMALSFYYKIPPLFTLIIMFWSTACFTTGLAPLGWVVLSELYPNRIRGKAMSLACFVLFLCNFMDKQIFPVATDLFTRNFGNPAGTFLIYATICCICVIFIWRLLPETKDKSLEEIGEFWLKKAD